MINNLAIFIPTYNRPSILKSNLVNIVSQAQEFNILFIFLMIVIMMKQKKLLKST